MQDHPGLLVKWFTSNWNLWGMSLALAGASGVLAGVISTGWPFIVGGLYFLGVLIDAARPRPRSPSLPPGRSNPAPSSPAVSQPPAVSRQPDPAPGPMPSPKPLAYPHPLPLPVPVPLPLGVPAPGPKPDQDNHLGIEGLTDLKVIGRGGFSTVYSARESAFDRKVAVKVLHDLDEQGRRWFEREGSLMGRLTGHPHIITPFQKGFTRDGAPFMIMEFVSGGSLEDRLAIGPLPWTEAVGVGVEVCDALDHAHEAGVLHRDVKPANILLTRRGAKLADFGISALRGATATASETALTLAHSPPEAFDGGTDQRDERSDLYSLGSTLFKLIAGRAPFDLPGGPSGPIADSAAAYLHRIANCRLSPLGSDVVPAALDALLMRTLAKNPADRPATAAELGAALARIADQPDGAGDQP